MSDYKYQRIITKEDEPTIVKVVYVPDEVVKQIRADAINDYYRTLNEKINTDTNLKDTIREIHDNVAQEMYCKGIDELVQKVKEHQYVLHILSDFMNCEDYGMFTVGIEQIAEELKAGGENV